MATFLPGVSDAPAQQRLYTPDYQFLTQVYGTKQAQYDRGFNMMRTMYNSKLGAQVSSEDNASFRDEFFKKAQDNLKQAAGVDLSNPNNIKKAMSIFDPLVNDEEFNYDVNMTSYLHQQLQRGEALKNSHDPEQRRLYNEMASEYVGNALQDLQGARRGDGSIRAVRKRDFVAFEDETKFLQELSQKTGLKVTKVKAPGDGYIYKMTNGEQAVDAMTEWATTMMGDKFDAQHRVKASVLMERQAKGLMESAGISKQEAMQQVGAKVQAGLIDQHAKQAVELQGFAEETDKRIQSIERTHGKTMPANVAERYQQLQEMKKVMDERVRNHAAELESLNDPDYVTGNLVNIMSSQVKRNAAQSWGRATALATEEQDISSDTTTTTKWKMALDQSLHNSQMRWNYAKHASDREFDMYKLGVEADRHADQRAITLQNNMANQDIARQRLEIEQLKAQNDGKMPGKVDLGSYTAPGQTMDVSQVLAAEEQTVTKNIFNNAFAPDQGLLKYVIGPDSHKYYPTLSKLQRVAAGDGNVQLSDAEIRQVKDLGGKVGVKINALTNRAQARAAVLNIAHATYKHAESGPEYDESGMKVTNASQVSDTMTKMLSNMSQMISVTQRNMLNNRLIAQQVLDRNGRPLKGFEKAQIYGYDAQNNPLVDLSQVDPQLRASLGATVAKNYREQTRTTGRRMAYSGENPALFVNALNPNMIQNIRLNNKDITAEYLKGESSNGIIQAISQMGIPDLQKTFGESVIANYDPAARTVELQLNLAANSPLKGFQAFKGGVQGTLNVTMSYDAIMSNPTLRAKFGEDVRANSASYGGIGRAADLMNDETAVIRQTPFQKKQGFEYSAFLGEDATGQPIISLNYKYLDPIKNQMIPKSLAIPVNPRDRDTYEQVDHNIERAFHGWRSKVSEWEKEFVKNTPKQTVK